MTEDEWRLKLKVDYEKSKIMFNIVNILKKKITMLEDEKVAVNLDLYIEEWFKEVIDLLMDMTGKLIDIEDPEAALLNLIDLKSKNNVDCQAHLLKILKEKIDEL